MVAMIRTLTACMLAGVALAVPRPAQAPVGPMCGLPESTLVRTEGKARLEAWEFQLPGYWFSAFMPVSPEYDGYRAHVIKAGADRARPGAHPPTPRDAAERELWRREGVNEALMYSGVGRVRRIQCLEAALFARQHTRYSQLRQPTEFIAHILRRAHGTSPFEVFKVYFGASDEMFPPKSFYGLAEVRADVAAGWTYQAVLHNHTIRSLSGNVALGVPAPSTSDVEMFTGLVASLGLREVLVTNGLFTGVVAGEHLSRFSTR